MVARCKAGGRMRSREACLLRASYQASNWRLKRGGWVKMTSAPASTCTFSVKRCQRTITHITGALSPMCSGLGLAGQTISLRSISLCGRSGCSACSAVRHGRCTAVVERRKDV